MEGKEPHKSGDKRPTIYKVYIYDDNAINWGGWKNQEVGTIVLTIDRTTNVTIVRTIAMTLVRTIIATIVCTIVLSLSNELT